MINMGYRTLPSLAVSKGARWIAGPLGPYLSTPYPSGCAHVGMSYDQWVSVLVHRNRLANGIMPGTALVTQSKFPAYARAQRAAQAIRQVKAEGGTVSGFDGWGDVCTRTERRYKRKLARYKKKKKQFKRRGRRFLGIRTGSGKKRLATIKRRMARVKAKAKSKSCAWVGRKKRTAKIKQLEKEEKQLEAKLSKEQKASEKQLQKATEAAIKAQTVEARQPGANPVLVLGAVGIVGLIMVAIAKKKK